MKPGRDAERHVTLEEVEREIEAFRATLRAVAQIVREGRTR
jgi:hypothetical protein